jgi:outer membrane protein assembly factor BamB
MHPVDPAAFESIEPETVRVFLFADGAWSPVWDSGVQIDRRGVWARVQKPGLYVPIGLPRDRVVRALLRSVAVQRQLRIMHPPDRRAAVTTERLKNTLAATPRAALQRLRQLVSRAAMAGATDPALLQGLRRGRAGGVMPPPLPGGGSLEEFIARASNIDGGAEGLPEEALFKLAAVGDENAAPWFFPVDEDLAPDDAAALRPLQLRELRAAELAAGGTRAARAAAVGIPPSAHWWMYHRDPMHSGLVTDSNLSRTNVSALRLRGAVQLGGPVVSVPAVVNNNIYVGIGNSRWAQFGSGGTLFRLDLATGAVLASFTFNTPPFQGSRQGLTGIASTPAVVDGRVYASGQDGRLYCLDALTLAPIWITNLRHPDPLHRQPVTHRVPAEGWSSPLVIGNRVYVGFGESESNTFGFAYCLDATTGTVLWLFCTTVFPGLVDNVPNVVPLSSVGMLPLPAGIVAAPDPAQRGGSPWSSFAYDPFSNRVIVGTGNVLPQHPLPQVKYSLGVLSLDALTGGSPHFFQPSNADNYRPDDDDVDMAASPLIFRRGNQSVVAIGSKNGSFFLLDAATLTLLARRQLLPRRGGNGGFPGDDGELIPEIDPHPVLPDGEQRTENFYGTFSCPAAHPGLQRLFVGVGGFSFGVGTPGIDTATTPFLRALNWDDLTDAWPIEIGADGVRRYTTTRPPMYTTPGEAGFASPVVVNDVVFMSTSRPGLYAFDAETGVALWSGSGLGMPIPNSFTLGPVVYGDFVVLGSANLGVLVYSL